MNSSIWTNSMGTRASASDAIGPHDSSGRDERANEPLHPLGRLQAQFRLSQQPKAMELPHGLAGISFLEVGLDQCPVSTLPQWIGIDAREPRLHGEREPPCSGQAHAHCLQAVYA